MSFHFQRLEVPGRALRRVGRERVRKALARLGGLRRPAAIHGVRKDIKKLRALFQLARGEIGGNTVRRAIRTLRAAAGQLAGPRDARVRLKVFETLARRDANALGGLGRALARDARRESRRFRRKDAAAAAGQCLRRTARCLKRLKIEAAGWAAIEPGLHRAYRRARQAGRQACREPSSENLHAWRKRAKCLDCQLQLVCPDWPDSVQGLTQRLEQLGDALGEDHDLELLRKFAVSAGDGPAGESAVLLRRIGRRQKKWRARAIKIGRDVFAEKPAAFCARLGRHWNAWHGRRAGRP